MMCYCNHCLKLIVAAKEAPYICDQCPGDSFYVCNQCITLMPTHHPSMHTFSKKISNSVMSQIVHDLEHLDITCDQCGQEHFNGIRYQCQKCEPSYNLCEQCIGKTHYHHKFKIIPNPSLLANNKYNLAKRAMRVIATSSNARDSLTGWTKTDAEAVIQDAERDQAAYQTRLQTIVANIEAQKMQAALLSLQVSEYQLQCANEVAETLAGHSRIIYGWR